MGLDSWSRSNSGDFESAEAFSGPPLKSRQFLAVTFLVAGLAVGDILALIRLSGRVPIITLLTIGLVMVEVLGNWVRALVVHQKLNRFLTTSESRPSLATDPAVDLALRAASSMAYWGTATPAVVGMTALFALLQVVLWMR
jgi:xanthosine utilization system XapX-like protein